LKSKFCQSITFRIIIIILSLESIRNPSVRLSLILGKDEKIEHYIRIKTHKLIVLKFWVENSINALYSWTQISLVFILRVKPPL